MDSLSRAGAPYAIIVILFGSIGFLYRAIITQKDEQIKRERDLNDRREMLQETVNNLIAFAKGKNKI